MNRLTHERASGIKSGYWSPNKKQELVDALAEYENTGLTPEEIKNPSIFEFDFTGVESFDCQCGRHYVNTAAGHAKHCEASAKWIPVEERLPENQEELVLIQVSGKPKKSISLENALELATYNFEEGWILEQYPEWNDAFPVAWMHLPQPYLQNHNNSTCPRNMTCSDCPLEDTEECNGESDK